MTVGTVDEDWARAPSPEVGARLCSMATVLVVDDEPIVRDVVVRYLRREGFTTLEAGDGDARAHADRDRRARVSSSST